MSDSISEALNRCKTAVVMTSSADQCSLSWCDWCVDIEPNTWCVINGNTGRAALFPGRRLRLPNILEWTDGRCGTAQPIYTLSLAGELLWRFRTRRVIGQAWYGAAAAARVILGAHLPGGRQSHTGDAAVHNDVMFRRKIITLSDRPHYDSRFVPSCLMRIFSLELHHWLHQCRTKFNCIPLLGSDGLLWTRSAPKHLPALENNWDNLKEWVTTISTVRVWPLLCWPAETKAFIDSWEQLGIALQTLSIATKARYETDSSVLPNALRSFLVAADLLVAAVDLWGGPAGAKEEMIWA